MKKYIFGLILLTGFFYLVFQENYKFTKAIEPAALLLPVWSGPETVNPFFVRSGFLNLTVTPFRRYTVSGLVMKAKRNSALFSVLSEIRSVQPATVSLAFADNLRTGAYKDVTNNLGGFNWPAKSVFNCGQMQQIAIVTSDTETKIKICSLKPGDQVTLSGMCATQIEVFRKGDTSGQPSATLKGEPNGSILYLADASSVKILQRGSRVSYNLFLLSGLLSVGMLFVKLKY